VRNAILVVMVACFSLAAVSQTPPSGDDTLTFHVSSKLVLVDVIPEYEKTEGHTTALLTDLKQQDFRGFDNRKEMPIRSFDVGATHGTRPIALWLIVQCPLGFPSGWASDFIRGDTHFLRPALSHLDPKDAVGVAHWCDTGTASIDLPPGHDPDAALHEIDRLLDQKVSHGENRSGELAMQQLIRLIVTDTRSAATHGASTDRLPVLVFLYGDHSGTYALEADTIIQDLLETSGIVFGISDGKLEYDSRRMFSGNEVNYLVHHYSQETGGDFYTTPVPKLYSSALDYILSQLHLRYTLGFKPLALDGKRHTLKVELTKEAQSRFHGVTLRFRQRYIPVAPEEAQP